MANDFTGLTAKAVGLALACLMFAGCAGTPPWPFNDQPVVMRAPAPPGILSASHRPDLPPCPQPLIAQAQWLARNMARVRLGYNKLQVVSIIGDPANSETFSLSNGAAVEVLFYHTPETICRVSARGEGLMPLVFQDDRLLGYGQNYYKQFIVPMMRVMATPVAVGASDSAQQGIPQQRVMMTPAPSLPAAPARSGRLVQEDLPVMRATPPAGIYAPTPVPQDRNGYTAPMQGNYSQYGAPYSGAANPQTDGQPAAYGDDGVQFNTIGRGAPIQ